MNSVSSNGNLQPLLKYPIRIELLMGMFLLSLFFGGFAFYLGWLLFHHYVLHSSAQTDPLGVIIAVVLACIGLLVGGLFLQGLIRIFTHWNNYTLIIDKEGFHGIAGISLISWNEISSIGDSTLRYNALDQRVHYFTICVRSLKKILKREHGSVHWLRKLGKSPNFIITNIKRKDIQSALKDVQQMFAQEIDKYGIAIYGVTKETSEMQSLT
jgi:hypothetical protein